MTAAGTEVDTYAERVRAALADLPPADRGDLVADLEDHLREVTQEHPDASLEALLGSPEAYAADLRSSAGLPPVGGPPVASGRRLSPGRAAAATADFLRELLPAWWVLRGAVLAWALIRPFTGNAGVVLLALLMVPASVLLGRWTRAEPRRRWLGYAASTAVLLLLIAVAGTATVTYDGTGSEVATTIAPPPPEGLDGVTNIHPYSSDGKPLTGVLLYDQDGNPIELPDRYLRDGTAIDVVPRYSTDGRVVGNVYPQEQTLRDIPLDARTGPQPRRVIPPSVVPPALRPR